MRMRILTILGALLVTVSASQMETAAARGVRKVVRAAHPTTQQLRDGVGSRPERHGTSAAMAVESKSCDIFWCYGN
jgi:hypothetical protein